MRLRAFVGLSALLATLGATVPVLAARQAPPEEPKLVEFGEGDTIREKALTPYGKVVEAGEPGERASLISVRVDFVDEILRSAEDL